MPPQRRNQGLAPPHQPTPPRAFVKQRISIARAAVAPRGKGRGVVSDSQTSPPLSNDDPIIGDDDDDVANILISSLSTMWSRRVGPTSLISKRKHQERQIDDRIVDRSKSTIHDPRSVVVKEGLFDVVARDLVDNVARKREYEINKRMLETRARVEVQREKEQCE